MKRAQLFFTTSGPGSTNGKWVVVLHQTPAPGTRVALARRGLAQGQYGATAPKGGAQAREEAGHDHDEAQAQTQADAEEVHDDDHVRHDHDHATHDDHDDHDVANDLDVGRWIDDHDDATTTTTTSPRPTTTTTICRVPTTTTTIKQKKRVKPKRYRIGDATWYRYIPGTIARRGTCPGAHASRCATSRPAR